MQTELTPTIAEMSEVVAKYMGYKQLPTTTKIVGKSFNHKIPKSVIYYYHSWEGLHEVWEKVRGEEKWTIEKRFDKVTFFKRIEKSFMFGTPLETLTALYNCIIFINQLKGK